jgi:Cu+-exporting ATPase
MVISDTTKAPSEEYKGKVYYFCSDNCKKTFKKSPKSYIEGLLKR